MAKAKLRWYKKPKPALLGWQDAHSMFENWVSPKEMTKWAKNEGYARIKSIGMLMGESKHYYIMSACNQSSGDFYSHIQRVPKGCITTVEPLRWGKKIHKTVPGRLRR